jgi:hypothetical protein
MPSIPSDAAHPRAEVEHLPHEVETPQPDHQRCSKLDKSLVGRYTGGKGDCKPIIGYWRKVRREVRICGMI